MKILIVDDEPDFLATCVRLLALMGHEAVTATNAVDAMSRIDQEAVHLVITDLRLGPLGGQAVVRHARRARPPVPVIVVTGQPSPEAVQTVREAGAMLLPKPMTPAELKAAIEQMLTR